MRRIPKDDAICKEGKRFRCCSCSVSIPKSKSGRDTRTSTGTGFSPHSRYSLHFPSDDRQPRRLRGVRGGATRSTASSMSMSMSTSPPPTSTSVYTLESAPLRTRAEPAHGRARSGCVMRRLSRLALGGRRAWAWCQRYEFQFSLLTACSCIATPTPDVECAEVRGRG
jgi:hypothetical protein